MQNMSKPFKSSPPYFIVNGHHHFQLLACILISHPVNAEIQFLFSGCDIDICCETTFQLQKHYVYITDTVSVCLGDVERVCDH